MNSNSDANIKIIILLKVNIIQFVVSENLRQYYAFGILSKVLRVQQ